MSKQKPPAFQFYVKDYLSGAARRMTLPALGAYLNLLCTAWDSDPIATLPDDPEKLRRFAGASAEEWLPIKDEVMENFVAFEGDPNRLTALVIFVIHGRVIPRSRPITPQFLAQGMTMKPTAMPSTKFRRHGKCKQKRPCIMPPVPCHPHRLRRSRL
jgi:hypothetical protein